MEKGEKFFDLVDLFSLLVFAYPAHANREIGEIDFRERKNNLTKSKRRTQ